MVGSFTNIDLRTVAISKSWLLRLFSHSIVFSKLYGLVFGIASIRIPFPLLKHVAT